MTRRRAPEAMARREMNSATYEPVRGRLCKSNYNMTALLFVEIAFELQASLFD